ncbi:SGNH/GDSL hydrolase family protein [Lysobacter tyrosinilyticus]
MRLLLLALGLLGFASAAQAAIYDRLYVFGDSYSDTGAGYSWGNGPTAVARLAERMQLSFTHAKDPDANGQSINFSVAGAGTGENAGRELGGFRLELGMQNQVDDFVARVQRGEIRFDPDATLFFIEGGLNDVDMPTTATRDNLTRQIELLKSVGARHVSLALLPTRIPAFSSEGARLNPAYRALVPSLRKRLHIDVRLNRFGEYLDEILVHPARYGITDTQTRCAGNPLLHEDATPCAAPDAYFYYLEDHPSAAVHRIVGDKLYAEIVGGAR